VVLRIQRDRAAAEDLLQEVYVSVWKAAAGFDGARSQPLTWLTSIARNRAIDSLRRQAAQPQLDSATPGGADDTDDAPDRVAATPDDGPGPLELLSRASDARELDQCLQHLTPPQRQSVALAFYDGLSHAEVAERLREPLGTVKSWVRRALQTLRGCLERGALRDQTARRLNMDYALRPRADALAAAYVAGTLRGPARRRFEAAGRPPGPAPRGAGLGRPPDAADAGAGPGAPAAAAVAAHRAAPVAAAPAPAPDRWWRQLAAWRALSGLATVASLALAVLLVNPQPTAGPGGGGAAGHGRRPSRWQRFRGQRVG
jgi:RNA polymerase sigma factor (sigma-70 family)